MSKDTNKETKRPKKYRYTESEIAGIIGCSVSYVKKVRSRSVNMNTPLSRRILATDEVLTDGGNKLLKEVERILSL